MFYSMKKKRLTYKISDLFIFKAYTGQSKSSSLNDDSVDILRQCNLVRRVI